MSRRPNVALALLLGSAAVALTSCDPPDEKSGGGSNRYTYGTKIAFTQSGRATPYQVSGWSTPEPQFTWTEGDTAVLALRVRPTDSVVALRMRVAGFLHGSELPVQPVEVLVNDRKIADWQVGAVAEHTAMVPQELVKAGGVLTFTFRMPKAISPKAAGIGEDPRVLGMCVYEFELRSIG